MPMIHRGSVGTVYVARARGAIKVGFTTRAVGIRVAQLGYYEPGVLIASAPGSFIQEQYLHRTLKHHRSPVPLTQGREWYRESVFDDLWTAWERMFGFRPELAEVAA